MKRVLAVLAGLFGIGVAAFAARTVYTGPLVNEAGLAYNKNYALNVGNYGIDTLSATASYSSTTVSAQSFTGGSTSTGSITVTTVTGLAGAQGTNSLTVLSTSAITGASISLAGVTLTNSVHWYTGTSTNTTATSLKTAINTYVPNFIASIGSPSNKVTITCVSSGTWCNSVPLSVVGTSSITAAAASFSGGVDNAIIAINGVTLVQGRDWTVGASSAATANAIATAINADATLSQIIQSTAPLACGGTLRCGIIRSTSTAAGTAANYSLFSSSQAALTIDGVVTTDTIGRGTGAMRGGTDSAWAINSPNITITSNPFWARNAANGQASLTGFAVLYSTPTTALSPLIGGTTYYIIPVDANTIKLASSSANAQAGTAITLLSSSTLTTAPSYTLTPLAIAGTPGLKWQVSNDGNLWQDFTTTSSGVAVSSVSISAYTAGGASTSWDFGNFGYSYIRMVVTAPTAGALNLLVTLNGKTNSSR